MLTLEYIGKVRRMMEQSGRDPISGREYVPEPCLVKNNVSHRSCGKTIEVRLGYECGSDGDLRIIQR